MTEILKEIGQSSKDNGEIVLVLVQSAKTCCQLKNVIDSVHIFSKIMVNTVYLIFWKCFMVYIASCQRSGRFTLKFV